MLKEGNGKSINTKFENQQAKPEGYFSSFFHCVYEKYDKQME